MPREALTRTVETDGALATGELTLRLAQELESRIWGQGFPQPLFCDSFALESQRRRFDRSSVTATSMWHTVHRSDG